jgi:hypothetical protein
MFINCWYFLLENMADDKKPLSVTQKFVASMLENSQKTHEVRAQSVNNSVDPSEIDKVMLNIKKGVYRTK